MRSNEAVIARGVTEYLNTVPSGEASLKAIKANLPRFCALSPQDRAPSPTRPGEEVWEQQVRNIVSHRTTPGNFIADGYLSRRPRRLSITPNGRRLIKKRGSF